jgi:hypothetical protein
VYLRFVHLYDYYSGEEFSDEVEMVKLRGFAHLRRKAKEVRLPVRAAAIPVSMLTSSINRSRPAESLDPPLCPISPWLSAPSKPLYHGV